jgi:hypothetical protein
MDSKEIIESRLKMLGKKDWKDDLSDELRAKLIADEENADKIEEGKESSDEEEDYKPL